MAKQIPQLSYYDTRWKHFFRVEKQALLSIIPNHIKAHIIHIGSTAVDGMVARPIIDIVIGIENPLDVYTVKDVLMFNKYAFYTKRSSLDDIVFYKQSVNGAEYVLHLTKYNGETYQSMLKMVKTLLKNKELAQRYSNVKLQLIDTGADLLMYAKIKRKFIRENIM